jgi:hypothetical protein
VNRVFGINAHCQYDVISNFRVGTFLTESNANLGCLSFSDRSVRLARCNPFSVNFIETFLTLLLISYILTVTFDILVIIFSVLAVDRVARIHL